MNDEILSEIYNIVKTIKKGKVADYIPELGKVNPDNFGISVCTVEGHIYNIGDYDLDFCLQSTSKPFSYCIARETLGSEKVHNHVGYEPSGLAFNAFTLNKQGLPHNPLINAGAIMIASLIAKEEEPAERFNMVKDYICKISGGIDKIGFDNSVFLSEKQHADRNTSLAYYMRENGAFGEEITPGMIQENLDLYFQCCSMLINCKIGAVMSATLANGGVCPLDNMEVFSKETVRDCLTIMYGCGMYDFSGQFAFEVGLPAKSGVSGCILLVVPNRMGVCIWSPPLDDQGNSVKGIEVCKILKDKLSLHIFENIVQKKDLLFDNIESIVQTCINSAAKGDLDTLKKIKEHGFDFNKGDYDNRTPLHLAVNEGKLDVVNFLIEQNVDKNVKDRWGNRPIDDIKNKDSSIYLEIKELLK
tara:strand:- start:919 stop:2166 length:1248 start_codon:yes stop_codon:yes gene_type:complete